jgi:soluble lytic murein transglycosylase-like protein
MQARWLLFVLALVGSPVVHGALYFCKAPDGTYHFSRVPLSSSYRLLLDDDQARSLVRRPPAPPAVIRPVPARLPRPLRRSPQYAYYVDQLARARNLDPRLVHAVILNESSYDPAAVSPAGAVGLMQLMNGTARRYGVVNRTDPLDNIYAGIQYLADLSILFAGNLELTLAAYNAGENAVIKYGNRVPPYRETAHYVHKVLSTYQAARGE